MADNNLKDVLGRMVESLDQALGDLKESIRGMLKKQDLGAAVPYAKESSESLKDVVDTIDSLLTEQEDNNDTVEKIEKLIREINNSLKKIAKPQKSAAGGEADAFTTKAGKSAAEGGKKAGKPGGVIGGEQINKVSSTTPITKDDAERLSQAEKSLTKMNTDLAKMSAFGGVGMALTGALRDWEIFHQVFKGVIQDETEYMINMRAIAYQTQGITADTRGLQDKWQETGKVVAETGQNLSAFQKEYVKNLKGGVRTQKEMLTVTKAGLSASTMIGANADSTNDLFAKWHMQLGMSANQMSQLDRDMQSVARSTGVTGDHLVKVMQESEDILKTMRNVGTLTSGSVKNVMMVLAEAEKSGVGENVKSTMKALSSGYELLQNTSKENQNFIFGSLSMVGRQVDGVNGVLLNTRAGMRDLAKGAEKLGESYGWVKDAEQVLDPDTLNRVNLGMMSGIKRGTKELQLEIETYKFAGMNLADKLAFITKKQKEQNNTAEENLQLEKQKSKLKEDSEFGFLSQFSEKLKTAKSVDSAFKNTLKGNEDAQEDLRSMGLDISNSAESTKKLAVDAAKRIDKINGTNISAAIGKAMDSKDPIKMREAITKLQVEGRKANIKEMKSLNPLDDMAQKMNKMNESIRSFTRPGLLALTGTGLKLLVLSGTLVSIMASVKSIKHGVQAMAEKAGVESSTVGMLKGLWAKSKAGLSAFKESTAAGEGVMGGVKSAAMIMGGKKVMDGAKSALSIFSKGATTLEAGATTLETGGATLLEAGGATLEAGGATLLEAGGATLEAGGATLLGGEVVAAEAGVGIAAETATGLALGPIAIAIAAAIAAVGGIVGGFNAFNAAANIFDKEQEELTFAEKTSAMSAGVLTGALNFLSFGAFNNLLGSTGEWTKALAKVYLALEFLFVPFAALWGIIVGTYNFIKNVLIGAWEGLKAAFEPIVDVFNDIKEALSPIADMFNGTNMSGDVFDSIVEAFSWLGKAVGWVAKELGAFTGFILKVFFDFFRGLTALWTGVFGGMWESIKAIFEPIVDLVQDTFSAISDVFTGVFTVIEAAFAPIIDLFSSLFGSSTQEASQGIEETTSSVMGFVDIMKALGNAIGWVFKIVGEVNGFFVKIFLFPFKIFAKITSIIGKRIGGLVKLFKKLVQRLKNVFAIISGLWDNTIGAMAGWGQWLWDNTIGRMVGWGQWLWDNTIGRMIGWGEWLWNNTIGRMIGWGEWLWNNTIGRMIGWGEWLWNNTVVRMAGWGKWLWDNTIGAMAGWGQWLWDNTVGGISNLGSYLWEQCSGALSKVWDWFIDHIPGGAVLKEVGGAIGDAWDWLTGAEPAKAGDAGAAGAAGAAAKAAMEAGSTRKYQGGASSHYKTNLPTSPQEQIMRAQDLDQFQRGNLSTQNTIPNLEARTVPFASNLSNNGMMNVPTARAAAQPMPLTDVYGKMNQERAGASAGVQSIKSEELKSIDRATNEQVDRLSDINSTLEDIKRLLTPNIGSMSGQSPSQLIGSPETRTASFGSTDYGKWQFGRNGANASSQVLNDGTS